MIKVIKGILQMSQDSEEIKTIEQWRWSEMQGLELVASADPSDPFKTNPPTPTLTPTHPVQEASSVAAAAQETKGMESSEPKKDSSGVGGGGSGSGSGSSSSSSGEKPEAVPTVGFKELFRFADGLDYILMAIGSVGALVHGCSLPLFLRFFADLVNSFGSNANNMDKMMQEVLKVLT